MVHDCADRQGEAHQYWAISDKEWATVTEGGQSTYEDRQTCCISEAKLKYSMERLEDISRAIVTLRVGNQFMKIDKLAA